METSWQIRWPREPRNFLTNSPPVKLFRKVDYVNGSPRRERRSAKLWAGGKARKSSGTDSLLPTTLGFALAKEISGLTQRRKAGRNSTYANGAGRTQIIM